jgi:hypothetical protein
MSRKKDLSREQAQAALMACRQKLGHVPTLGDLEKHTGILRHDVIRLFGNYAAMLKECGLERLGSGMKAGIDDLLLDWARVARAQKSLPKLHEYAREGGAYSEVPFRKRFGVWSNVPGAMKRYAMENGLTHDWQDVIELIDSRPSGRSPGERKERPLPASKVFAGRPLYGPLIHPSPLICEPTNESGVIFLFGSVAERLGFQMLRIQTEFPDGEALRRVSENRLQQVKLEFEHQSRNFLYHNHDAAKCDLIVCWEHNWPECPLEVLELKTAIRSEPKASS